MVYLLWDSNLYGYSDLLPDLLPDFYSNDFQSLLTKSYNTGR